MELWAPPQQQQMKNCNRFPLSFYYRTADQTIKQATVYRDEGNVVDLYVTLNRYVSLVSEVIPQHQCYPTYSSKEKLHHKKVLKEFVNELETLKPLLGKLRNSGNKSLCNSQSLPMKDGAFPSLDESKVIRCGSTGTKCLIVTPTPRDDDINVHVVKHFYPSPVLSYLEDVPQAAQVSRIIVPDSDPGKLKSESSSTNAVQDVHISARLMEDFLELARENTNKNLETCGVLGALLKNRTFYVISLIVPKQESTSSSCQALNEEEIYALQDEQSLFPVGWIHTHPSQTCFMSSIDLHTQYSYQVMLPESVAIVLAPTDQSRSYGVYRLTNPGGTTVLKDCQDTGFHTHQEPADGSPIYEDCSSVYLNSNLRFEIIDLRYSS
ncbi:AMSH-like ubiquitin thioesterase 3 [Acorus gramineus]|uniref:AMSH-like ubiquitin thioesterase 3 n=1 Tax=Acorus gramineus TaxID=55184 RepID=A0AAV9BXU7_ACOGR|nr:AMSH-like ubiquitin thioesterase 3 [Acorus gramineus]